MKSIYLSICLTLVISSFNFFVYSQQANFRKNNPDQPFLFTPKSHDLNFLKSAKFPDQSFYQRKSEWKHIIDTTWGPGVPLSEKLLIFNAYAKAIHDQFDSFKSLNLNWDSLYNHYLIQINDSTSKGAFSSIISHFTYSLKDLHSNAYDKSVVLSALNPGVPILLISSFMTVEHFGAVTTVMPDSTTLVLRVVPNHPLGLEPGDIILGYEGIPWKNLVSELMNAGLPMFAMTGGCKTTQTYHNLMGVGLNWHLFSTIDIIKYYTGDTLHLSVEPLLTLKMPPMSNNEQLPVKDLPFPKVWMPLKYPLQDTLVTYGILENTNIGYIFLAIEDPNDLADTQFYEAVNALKKTDALIIDMRLNYGGYAKFDKAFNILFNEYNKTIEGAIRCNANSIELCPWGNRAEWQINGKNPDYYDRPIAVLLGPSCISMGDITAQRLRLHPMVRFFGASSGSVYGWSSSLTTFPDWNMSYSIGDAFWTSQPGIYLNRTEFPIDYPIWFNKDDVAKGIDPIVKKAREWINNLTYGHSIVLNKSFFSCEKDTLKATATIENPNSHTVSAKLIFESLDGSVIDSTEMNPLNFEKTKDWEGIWETKGLAECIYWISLKVSDQTDGTSFTNKHITRFTTVPLLIDYLTVQKNSTASHTVQLTLKNAGKILDLTDITINLTTNDPWVKSITPIQTKLSYLKPGQVRRTPSFTISVDEASFPNLFNLKYSFASEGWPYWTIDTTLAVITGIDPLESLPLTFNLHQNFPNPFNSQTTIAWQLAHGDRVTLCVFDLLGRKVDTLVDEYRSPGKYESHINAATLPKGIYFYQLKAGKSIQTRKMILLK